MEKGNFVIKKTVAEAEAESVAEAVTEAVDRDRGRDRGRGRDRVPYILSFLIANSDKNVYFIY